MLRYFAASLCGLILLWPISAFAQVPGPEETVSIDVAGANLQTVLNMLGRQTGIEAVIREGEKPFSLVNVHLSDATLTKALRVIALSAGALVTRNEDGVYVFRQADAAPDPPAPTPIMKVMRSTSFEPQQWYTVGLAHTSAGSVLRMMHWNTVALPTGVTRISAIQDDKLLLFQATAESYLQIRQIVKILDIGRFSFAMNINCWTANVSNDELGSLVLEKRQYADQFVKKTNEAGEMTLFKFMDVGTGPFIDKLFDKLTRSNRCSISTAKYQENKTQEWTVDHITFQNCQVRTDDSLRLGWAGEKYAKYQDSRILLPSSNQPAIFAQLIMHRAQVFALHPYSEGTGKRIIFIKAVY